LEIIEYLSSYDATNTWAVSGEYTETGLPILTNDPHLEAIAPSQWYQLLVNYTRPDGSNWVSSGKTTPGNSAMFGKNPYFATGCSVSHGDNQDLYR
jgi:penicillin amidase